jgi:hypothetical protein
VLGAISGLSIVWIGGMMLYKRAHAAARHHDPTIIIIITMITIMTIITMITITARTATATCRKATSRWAVDRPGRQRRTGSVPFRAGVAAQLDRAGPRGLGPAAVGRIQLRAGVVLMGIGVLVLYAKHFAAG